MEEDKVDVARIVMRQEEEDLEERLEVEGGLAVGEAAKFGAMDRVGFEEELVLEM